LIIKNYQLKLFLKINQDCCVTYFSHFAPKSKYKANAGCLKVIILVELSKHVTLFLRSLMKSEMYSSLTKVNC